MVRRLVWDQDGAGSIPVTPTSVSVHKDTHIFYICYEYSDYSCDNDHNNRCKTGMLCGFFLFWYVDM